jgi:type I restriction enzyme, S subunit
VKVGPGYQQTEVGAIPEDWSIRSLSSICDVRDGTHESPRFFDHGVPFLTSKNIVDGRLDLENVSYISETDAADFDRRSKVDRHDILMSMIGTIGSAVLVDCEPNFCIKNVALLKPRNVAPPFLIQLINSTMFQRYLADNLDGGIQKFISLGTLRRLSIPLPNEPEQRAIATALSDVDGVLAKLDQFIAKKRDLKQAAMQQLLTGKTRLPGFLGEWESRAIGPQIDLLTGFPFPSSNYSESGVRLLRGSNVKRGETDWTEGLVQYWPIVTPEIRRYELDADDLVIAMDGSLVGRSYARLRSTDLPAVLLQRVARIRSKTIDVGFLTQVVSSERFVQYCDSVKTVTAIPHISAANIRNFEMAFPPSIGEQTAIATILFDMDAEIATLEARRDKTRALKRGMMQELLTGRIRLV